MRKRRQSTSSIEGLRLAIDCLPVATREAMLRGLGHYERILIGAYTDEHGGVCPMLAAHRCGARTKFLAFAKSWDRFGRAGGRNKRVATPREVRILVGQLQASLASTTELELDQAIVEHHTLVARSMRETLRDRDRLSARPDRLRARRSDRRSARLPGQLTERGIASEADPRGPIRARRLRESARRFTRPRRERLLAQG
jgi:hypothetical protein